jgi:hypothetical protein
MPKSISATDRLLCSPCPHRARRYARELLLALGAVECHAAVGGHAELLPALLRDVVIITIRLADRSWLEANADAAGAFIALQAALQPPPLPELDRILADVLSERFGLACQANHLAGSVRP